MDKFVNLDVESWMFSKARDRKIHPHDFTFQSVISELAKMPPNGIEIHLRSQSKFLLFENYDGYFQFEDFANAIPVIEEQAGLEIFDTRHALGHDMTNLKKIADLEAPMNLPAHELLGLKKLGQVPEPTTMFNADIVTAIKKIYSNDLELYEEKFGKSELMKFVDAEGF